MERFITALQKYPEPDQSIPLPLLSHFFFGDPC